MRAVLVAADPVGQRRSGNVFKGGGRVDATRIRRCREVLSDPGARVLTGHMPFGVYVSRLDQRIGRITARAEGRGSEPEGLEALQARRDELAELLDLLRRRQASLVSP